MNPEDENKAPRERAQPVYQDPAQPYGRPRPDRPGLYSAQPLSLGQQQKAARSFLRSAGNRAALMPILLNLLAILLLFPAMLVWLLSSMKTFLPYYEQGGVPAVVRQVTAQTGTIFALALLCTVLGVACAILIARPVLGRKIFGGWKRPAWTASGFAKGLVLAFGISAGGELLNMGMEALSRATGLKLNAPDFSPTGNGPADILMLAYVCVLGPLMEETLFRGMILPSLRPWGDRLAVVVSAAMFALAHMNLVQGIPAFFLGLLFARMTLSAGSVVPSALTHILYNSLSMALLAGGINSNRTLQAAYIVFLAAAAAGSVVLLVLRRVDFRKAAPPDVSPAPAAEHPYRVVLLQSAAFWVAVALFAVFSFAVTGAAVTPGF